MATRTRAAKDKAGSPTAAREPGNAAPQLTLADLYRKVTETSSSLGDKLDKLSNDINQINKRFEELEDSVVFHSGKINEMEKEVIPALKTSLEAEIEKLQNSLIMMEIHNRKANLLFYGATEKRGEDIYTVLKEIFMHLGLQEGEANQIQVVNAHRLPRRNAAANLGPNPIIAKFCFMRDRDRILHAYEDQQRNRPRTSGATPGATPGAIPGPTHGAAPVRDSQPGSQQPRISVRTDLPPALKAQRGKLANEAYKMRREKGLSTKIVVQDAKVVLKWKEKGSTTWKNYIQHVE